MITENDIRAALNETVVVPEVTSRTKKRDIANACSHREDYYLGLIGEIDGVITDAWLGVSDEELETVMCVKEQLKALARIVCNTRADNV